MSRIGLKPIPVPQGTKIDIKENEVVVEGPKGKEASPLYEGLKVRIEKDTLYVERTDQDKQEMKGKQKKLRALHGLVRSLINNCIIGTNEGFIKFLEIKGVGYRAALKGKDIQFQLGLSHDVIFQVPSEISVKVNSPTELEVSGTNKEKVGQVAADIRSLKKPEPYKGKGIRYKDEHIIMKAGKAGKK